MICPSDTCGSGNVHLLSLYWKGLDPKAESKAVFAPPADPDGRLRIIGALAGIMGVAVLANGGIGAGFALLIAGLVVVAVGHHKVGMAEAARAVWERRRICLTCSEQWIA